MTKPRSPPILSDALVLAILSTTGFILTYNKLPNRVRRFLRKHALLVDVATFIVTYLTLGSSLTALTAGAMVAIMTSVLLHIMNNPNDFMYLYDFIDGTKIKFAELNAFLKEYGEQYRLSKGITTPRTVED